MFNIVATDHTRNNQNDVYNSIDSHIPHIISYFHSFHSCENIADRSINTKTAIVQRGAKNELCVCCDSTSFLFRLLWFADRGLCRPYMVCLFAYRKRTKTNSEKRQSSLLLYDSVDGMLIGVIKSIQTLNRRTQILLPIVALWANNGSCVCV